MFPKPDGDTLEQKGATPLAEVLAKRKHEQAVQRNVRKRRAKKRRRLQGYEQREAEARMDIDSPHPANPIVSHHSPPTNNPPALNNETTIASITTTISKKMHLHSPQSSHSNDADEDPDIPTLAERLRIEQRNAGRRDRIERRDRVKARQAEEEAQAATESQTIATQREAQSERDRRRAKSAKNARRKARKAERERECKQQEVAKQAEMVQLRETAQEQMRVAAAKRKALVQAEVSRDSWKGGGGGGGRKRRGRDDEEGEDDGKREVGVSEWEVEGLGFKRLKIWEG